MYTYKRKLKRIFLRYQHGGQSANHFKSIDFSKVVYIIRLLQCYYFLKAIVKCEKFKCTVSK